MLATLPPIAFQAAAFLWCVCGALALALAWLMYQGKDK